MSGKPERRIGTNGGDFSSRPGSIKGYTGDDDGWWHDGGNDDSYDDLMSISNYGFCYINIRSNE